MFRCLPVAVRRRNLKYPEARKGDLMPDRSRLRTCCPVVAGDTPAEVGGLPNLCFAAKTYLYERRDKVREYVAKPVSGIYSPCQIFRTICSKPEQQCESVWEIQHTNPRIGSR